MTIIILWSEFSDFLKMESIFWTVSMFRFLELNSQLRIKIIVYDKNPKVSLH